MNQQPTEKQIQDAYSLARERYALFGVDTGAALAGLAQIPISLHCWQGDDVAGFENPEGELGGGIAATGNYHNMNVDRKKIDSEFVSLTDWHGMVDLFEALVMDDQDATKPDPALKTRINKLFKKNEKALKA